MIFQEYGQRVIETFLVIVFVTSESTILDYSVCARRFHFFELGHNVFTNQMLKCPATFHSKSIMSKEDIQFGLASAY